MRAAAGFGYFEFALVGIPIVIGCIAIVVLFGERLLPTRTSKTLPPDLSQHATHAGRTVPPVQRRAPVARARRIVR